MRLMPPREKDGEIKFFFAKSLPYRPRMALVGLILAAGLALQVTVGFWPGLAVLVAAQLLGMNSGYDASPRGRGPEKWSRVTPDEYEKVRLRADQLKQWDEDFFDGTSTSGAVGAGVTAVLCVILYNVAASAWGFPDGYWFYFGIDAVVLLLPLWFIGTRSYLKKDRLIIKIDVLQRLMKALSDPSDVQVQPMLALADTDTRGKEPMDARLMIKLVGAPKDFYGVQVQLSINSVQGKDYPYLYCVLIAKKGSGLLKDYRSLLRKTEEDLLGKLGKFLFGGLKGPGGGPVDLIYEPSSPGDVDIIVVRRQTSRNSGFFTPPSAALEVVNGSLDLARALASPPPPPPARAS